MAWAKCMVHVCSSLEYYFTSQSCVAQISRMRYMTLLCGYCHLSYGGENAASDISNRYRGRNGRERAALEQCYL